MSRRRFASMVAAVIALFSILAVPSVASADGTGRGRLFVPGDHFNPGDALVISGAELDPGAALTLHLVNGTTAAEVGRTTVADDRTFTSTVTVPPAFPLGYAELTATDPGGTTWSTFVLIGDRSEGPAEREPIDERAIWVAVFAVGLVVVAGCLLLYRRESGSDVAPD
jgi:hypothetical protein